MNSVPGAELLQSEYGRANRQCPGPDDQLVVSEPLFLAAGRCEQDPLAFGVDLAGVRVEPELHSGGFQIRLGAMSEIPPVRHLARHAVGDTADREVGKAVGDHHGDLDVGPQLTRP